MKRGGQSAKSGSGAAPTQGERLLREGWRDGVRVWKIELWGRNQARALFSTLERGGHSCLVLVVEGRALDRIEAHRTRAAGATPVRR